MLNATKRDAMRASVFAICVAAGACLGAGMIFTHHGPGIRPLPPANTPTYRNSIRTDLLGELSAALQRYHKDHGSLPTDIGRQDTQICTSYGANCASKHLVDLSFLHTAGDYVTGIPQDPSGGPGRWNSGFTIAKLPDGTLRISAPNAELDKVIQVTTKL
jgi:hypothetical protein